jgi:phage recombination protein Bet
MSNELKKIDFTDDQVKLIKSQIAPKATNDELALFLYQARRTGLDPLARQIYCLPIGGKMSIQTSIDGFRVVAERSGDYAGQDEPIFIEKDGKLECAKVSVYRFKGEQRYLAAVGVAYMSEYKQSSPMWTKMPHTMLSKCAEALALRKAYPQDLSGIYTGDEMAQATEDVPAEITTAPAPKPVPAPPAKFTATQELLDEAFSLIANSTLDVNGQETATNSLANAKSQAAWDKIITRLKEIQS